MPHAVAENDNRDPSRAIVRDLKALAENPPPRGFRAGGNNLSGYPAVAADPSLRHLVVDLRDADWRQIADADPDDLAAGLDRLRSLGAARAEHDRAAGKHLVAAVGGDEAALDRLRAPVAEGGLGEPELATYAVVRARGGLDGLDEYSEDSMYALLAYVRAAPPETVRYWIDGDGDDYDERWDDDYDSSSDDAWDQGMLRACSDYVEVRDHEDGDAPGRYYR